MEWARPFLKWAGGKSQLLEDLDRRLPDEVKNRKIKRYIEPFVGGGAFFFHIAQRYSPEEIHILDINEELILAYRVIQRAVDRLVEGLGKIEARYLSLPQDERARLYYQIREEFNREKRGFDFENCGESGIERVIRLIFLNRTCYNGLYRVNSRGEFNVPFGKYREPRILNESGLRCASQLLKGVHIQKGDFSTCDTLVDDRTFVYFDPPYRPISRTSSFTAYSEGSFSDADQRRLARFFQRMHVRGARLMLSNSDPKNVDPSDGFFDQLYSEFRIERVPARRAISSNGEGRGVLNELVITNYR
ncbi:MAG: DNA adenine methylase [Methanomicrobiales archaeon]|nr:DNA adenine methylase [Methanomicrobiales archaeon]